MTLNRDQILAAKDIDTTEVQVPEWGGSVLVKALTGAERDRYEQSVVEQNGKKTKVNMVNARAKLVALAVVDDKGQPLFTAADIPALAQKSAAALDRIYAVASEKAGITDKDMAELTENFIDGQSGASTSA